MGKPALLVMAAGIGSRYGGLKQLDPVGKNGEVILDYAVYDAKRAGFETVIFIINHNIEADFRSIIGSRIAGSMDVRYAFQTLDLLPEGYAVPEGRTKPMGTAQAIYSAKDLVDGPVAVINADDYYGPDAFNKIYSFLSNSGSLPVPDQYAMVGYRLENTVTEHGHVARGVCSVENGVLTGITERTKIQCFDDGIKFTEDEGATWTPLPGSTVVSMNMWGLPQRIMDDIAAGFPLFLDNVLPQNPLKGEYLIPAVIEELVEAGKARVKVLESADKWYGVTYKEDKPGVVEAIAGMTASGLYPDKLWG